MKRSVVLILLSIELCLSTVQVVFAQPISYGGGDGSSMETAIIVMGATDDQQGVRAENDYVAKLHPDWRSEDSALLQRAGRHYDVNHYITKNGSESSLIFDVTEFFDKM